MDFFDSLIIRALQVIEKYDRKSYPYTPSDIWPEEEYSHVILQRDTVSELDGTGFNLVTSKKIEDGVCLIGDDIGNIKGKRKFARICIVQLEYGADEQKSYNLIRKIDYIKYHFFPEGYMIRTSSRAHKESVRVSKAAVKDGISFRRIGNMIIKKYKENPAVKGVQVYFITEAAADYEEIESLACKSNSIAETLNHVMNSVTFDCDTCNLKAVCNEVEGMKELHFKNKGNGMN